MKNIHHTTTAHIETRDLARDFREVIDEVVVWRHRLLRRENLTRPGLFIMSFVYRKGPLRLTDCSKNLGVSKPTVTKIIDNLESCGFVKRVRSGEDRRNYYIHLTPSGTEKIKSLDDWLESLLSNAIRSLDAKETNVLKSSLESFKRELFPLTNSVKGEQDEQ